MADWYLVVDGAADPGLYPVTRETRQHACLYEADYPEETLAALPHLVTLAQDEKLAEAWRRHESGRFWGMAIRSSLGFKPLRRQLRKFTTARLPLGDVVLFRFWDPRVFATFAESATPEEIGPFFNGIEAVIIDLGPGGRRRYAWDGGLVVQQAGQTAAASPAGAISAP
ncbi:MAG: DUF4123 domain-containing protein [Porphyrobacter sp.]|nr:DUF4123 domain-containing protein [Porphyrobacter sp.]